MSTTQSKSHLRVRALCEGAVFVAIAQVLSYLKLFELPNGGSITFAMLPIFLYCARWGFARGLLASFVFSCLQFIFDGGFAIGWISILGDYILAYTMLGLAGLFSKCKGGLFIGSVVGSVGRFVVNYIVGATIWAEYMPETFFNMTMTTPWFYSFLYNASYIFISLALCLVVEALLYKPLRKYITGSDLRG
ncbi:MAG: energy-coupled thiamine transporter ThiT [Bradyrhizobium sp.]